MCKNVSSAACTGKKPFTLHKLSGSMVHMEIKPSERVFICAHGSKLKQETNAKGEGEQHRPLSMISRKPAKCTDTGSLVKCHRA